MSAESKWFIVGGASAALTGTVLGINSPLLGLLSSLAVALLPLWLVSFRVTMEAMDFPRGERLDALWRSATFSRDLVLYAGLKEPASDKGPRLVSQRPHPLGWELTVRTKNPAELFESRALTLAAAFHVSRVRISNETPGLVSMTFVTRNPLGKVRDSRLTSQPTQAWRAPNGMTVTVGRSDDGRDLDLDLANDSHIALQGLTRSGKSSLAQILVAFAYRHPHMRVVGIDPSGLLLRHIRDSVNGTSPLGLENAARLLEELVAQMDTRTEALSEKRLDKLTDFSEQEPLILLVLEELGGLLAAANLSSKPLANRLMLSIGRLAAEGLKSGIRIVAISHRFDASLLGGTVRANFGTRLTFRIDNADSVRMLHPFADSQTVRWLAGVTPGYGVVDLPGESMRYFRSDFLSHSEFLSLLGVRP